MLVWWASIAQVSFYFLLNFVENVWKLCINWLLMLSMLWLAHTTPAPQAGCWYLCLDSVIFVCLSPDAVWDGEWGRSRDGCIRWEWLSSTGMGCSVSEFGHHIVTCCIVVRERRALPRWLWKVLLLRIRAVRTGKLWRSFCQQNDLGSIAAWGWPTAEDTVRRASCWFIFQRQQQWLITGYRFDSPFCLP